MTEPMQAAYDALLEMGWQEAGQTRSETFRLPTNRTPVYGGIGGKLVTMGGRLRLHLPDTDRYVTLGPRTTNFYSWTKGSEPTGFRSFPTWKTPVIAAHARRDP